MKFNWKIVCIQMFQAVKIGLLLINTTCKGWSSKLPFLGYMKNLLLKLSLKSRFNIRFSFSN